MLILWRIILLAATSVGVLICYPYYNNFGIITVFFVFLAALAAMMLLTWITSILFLSRSRFFNFLFDIAMVIGMIFFLLMFIPQEGPVRPLENINRGVYPSKKDINYGLKRLGAKKKTDAFKKEVINAVDDFKTGVNKIETMMPKD